ncbi:hypothetical protein BDQ12DRAFT_570989, partial [Crucibulum laeve]
CMLHTIHLTAIKLLENIGALSLFESEKASLRASAYQDAVTAPVDHSNDSEAALHD